MTDPPRVRIDWRKPGGRKPAGVIVCSRPSRWGNRWRVDYWPDLGRYVVEDARGRIVSRWLLKSEAIADCLRLYRDWLADWIEYDPAFLDPLRTATGLACYCDPADGCHVDILRDALAASAAPPAS